jgi:hypothetical protein
MGTTPKVLSPKVLLIEDKLDAVSQKTRDMITGTWNDIQLGGKGKFRRAKRALVTYADTAIKTTTGVDAVEKLVSIGTGVALAIFVSGAIAASVGTFGAMPIMLVIGALVTILTKKIFAAVRAINAKKLALKKLSEFATSMPDPEVKDFQTAASFLTEIYKDIGKINVILTKLNVKKGTNLKTTYADKTTYKLGDELTKRSWGFKVEVTDPKELANILGARLQRITKYCEWLQKYCGVLNLASVDLQDDCFADIENKIMHLVFWQVSSKGQHASCPRENCYAPGDGDVATRELTEQEVKTWVKNSKLYTQFANNQKQSAALFQSKAGTAVDIDDELEDSIGDQAKDFAKDIGTDFAFDQLIEKTAGDAMEEAFDHVGAAVLGSHVTFGLSSGVAMARQIHQKQQLHAKSGKIRQMLFSSDDAKTIEAEFDALMKELNTAKVLRILNLCANHYPSRIEDRFKKMKDALEKVKSRTPFQFTSCVEAQKFVRYLLKVHHYVGKQMTYTAILQVWVETLRKTAFHEA